MKANGSPSRRFETDESRSYFLTEIRIHPEFAEAQVEAHDEAQVEAHDAVASVIL